MEIEKVETEGDVTIVTLTGSIFRFTPTEICVTTRIPAEFSVGVIRLEPHARWHVQGWTRDELTAQRDKQQLSLGSDGFLRIDSTGSMPVEFRPSFSITDTSENTLATDLRGKGFGCGLYRLPGTSFEKNRIRQTMDETHPFFFHVFPPRHPDKTAFTKRIAHEGRPQKGRAYPNDELIRKVAKHAKILALHAYFWAEENPKLRPKLSRYRFRKCPWLSAIHRPEDEAELERVMATARVEGMKFVPYVSPRYSTAPDIHAELSRLMSLYNFDGFYLDGLRGNFVDQRNFIRALRQDLGQDSIIYLNGTTQPFDTARITAPFIDAHCDYVLRGDSGRAGLGRDDFLRLCVSGQGAGNQVGVWCHYGSSGFPFPFDRVPSLSDQRGAHAQQVQLWRRSFWWPGAAALKKFDDLQFELQADQSLP